MKFKSKVRQETVFFTELTVQDYKQIIKSILGDAPDPFSFVETLCDAFSNMTKKDVSFFKNLNIVDFFLFLLDAKIYSSGNIVKVGALKGTKRVNLEFNLESFQKDIAETFSEFIETKVSLNGVSLVFDCPSIETLLSVYKKEIADEYLLFVKNEVFINDTKTVLRSQEEIDKAIECISPKLLLSIIQKHKDLVSVCNTKNFLDRYKISETRLSFAPTIDVLIWFTKLMFDEPLDVLYDNLFYLCHSSNMNLSHLERCPVGEYMYYVNVLRSLQKETHVDAALGDNSITEEQ